MADKITFNDKGHILPYGTRETQVWDLDINEIKSVVNNNADMLEGLEGGYQGNLLIADTPTEDGYYLAGQSGLYVNAGNLSVNLDWGITFINVSASQTIFSMTVIPVSAQPTGEVVSGNTEAVEGGKIYTSIETAINDKVVMGTKPLTSTSSGLAGQIAYDTAINDFENRVVADGGVVESLECIPFIDNYLFVCIASNVWRRIPLESW